MIGRLAEMRRSGQALQVDGRCRRWSWFYSTAGLVATPKECLWILHLVVGVFLPEQGGQVFFLTNCAPAPSIAPVRGSSLTLFFPVISPPFSLEHTHN